MVCRRSFEADLSALVREPSNRRALSGLGAGVLACPGLLVPTSVEGVGMCGNFEGVLERGRGEGEVRIPRPWIRDGCSGVFVRTCLSSDEEGSEDSFRRRLVWWNGV